MTTEDLKKTDKAKGKGPGKIVFRCQGCGKYKQLEEMKVIKRFFPMLVVCQECEKEMH